MLEGTDADTLSAVKEHIKAWLKDDVRAVTLRSILLEYDFLTRREASTLLESATTEILSTHFDCQGFEVIRCCFYNNGGETNAKGSGK